MTQHKKRLKVYYLSISTFSDNHINTLHHLHERFEIVYGVIIPSKRANYTEEELAEYCVRHKIQLDAFHLRHRFRDPRNIATYYKVIRAIKKANPDIIYFTNFDQVYINLLFLLLGKNKTVIGFHDVVNHSNTRFDYLTNIGKNVLFRNFRFLRTYSLAQENILRERFPDKTVFTIPLPTMSFGPLQQTRENLQNGRKINFLFFGNILYYKGLDILLKAADQLSEKTTDFTITIAGRSEEWETVYEPLVRNKQIINKKVRFIENSEIPKLFGDADYLVLPYRDTTQSGPLMIAYNYNVPVITSSAAGFKEFIKPNESGLTFDTGDVESLQKTLERAISFTRAEYLDLKNRQSDFVSRQFSTQAIVDKYEEMFQQVSGIKKLR